MIGTGTIQSLIFTECRQLVLTADAEIVMLAKEE
jgi:hypothetical protein